ncbi:hypothetical protein FVEG_03770 [Fusarium verticillioides 7600]|uniref:Cytochrome P450 n=1 Tax=Gibberella moniliformis (strain M3125 / FGSC 7600) TaxID=334819 RepID=W7LR87_GIBM7|nr:hypothetical protein FVEG_03770 [Fusarium verticillioides 7600]EWG41713.1 hypothetical protein FVEG_03770 [Fusarium verticillioides 7600]
MFRFAGELDALPFIMDPAAHRVRRGRQTVFDAILDAEPDHSTKGLVDVAFSLVIGGTETTVTTITYGVWCILKNPNVEKKMLEELRTVETNSDGLVEYPNLMNLPYLTAVIHKTLRISSPAPGILTRLVSSGGTKYGSHFLPADTSVSTAQRLIHYDPVLFPEPETFMPERWLDNSDKASKKNLIPFGKGPRMCVGLNLSYMQAYVFLGNLIRRFDLSLQDKDQGILRWKDCIALHIEDDVLIKVNGLRALGWEIEGMHSEVHHMEPDWSEFMFGSPQDIPSTPANSRDFSHDTTFDLAVSMNQILNSPGSFLTSPPLESMFNDDLHPHDSISFPQSAISNSGTWPTRTEQLHVHGLSDDRISCQCSITPMKTWEALTINVSSKHPTSQRSIQAQKAAISRCEELVHCSKCASQPRNVILLIDICAKLLDSLRLQDRDLQADHQLSDHRSAVYEMVNNQDGDGDGHVRRNLWTSRMRRLGRLIAKVSELLDGDQWSAQRRLLQNAQLRFTGVMFGWQH